MSMFVYYVEKINIREYKEYVTAYQKLQGYVKTYQDDYINRAVSALKACKEKIKKCEVCARIDRLRNKKFNASLPPAPLEVKVGCTVRALNFESTAKVKNIFKARNGEGYVREFCELNKPIQKVMTWEKSALKAIIPA